MVFVRLGIDAPQSYAISVTQLLQFGHDTVRDTRYTLTAIALSLCFEADQGKRLTFSKQTIHHAANELQLVLQTEIDEVRVDEYAVRRNEGVIMLQEHGRRHSLAVHGRVSQQACLEV